ncbi:MAG: hypothetical protein ACPF9D_10095 [Owenweeksia sp.]
MFSKIRISTVSLILLLSFAGKAQEPSDTLDYSVNKEIPASIRAVVLETLSHYPELRETHIHFVFDDRIYNVFMQARPDFLTLLRPRKNRSYTIQMLPAMVLDDKSIPLQDLPEEVLKGWLGHELGHILDYSKRSGLNLIGFGAMYFLSPAYVQRAERRADIYAIQHGFGNYLIATKDYILSQSDLPTAYRQKIQRLYMSSEEVLKIIQEEDEKKDLD